MDLKTKIDRVLDGKGCRVETVEAGKNDVVPCSGCLYCLTRGESVCVNADLMSEVNTKIKDRDIIIYIAPILFGQFSSTIKNALDKSQYIKKDQVPFLIAVGYGDDLRDEEMATFMDIVKKHRGSANIVHPLLEERFEVFASRSFQDNDEICRALREAL